MKKVVWVTVAISFLLVVIALPLLFLFDVETFVLEKLDPQASDLTPSQIGWVAFLALAIDIFVPIPSSGVMTYCGAWFGDDVLATWPAVLICLAGSTVSVVCGYWLSRCLGPAFVKRWSNKTDWEQAQQWMNRFGSSFLVLLRGVPILAEASVLVAGAYRMNFFKVLAATSIANLGLATIYVLFGHFAGQSEWLPTAMIVAVILPLFGLYLIRPLQAKTVRKDNE